MPDVCKDFMEQIEKDHDRKTGDYNGFWDARNYLKDADQIKASVFLIHGLNDVNVQKKQFAQWWELLKKNEVPRKLWLHQGEHVDPLEVRGEAWLTTLNKWFAYWLYDIENDVMDEAMVEIEHVDQSWEELKEWPRKDAEDKTLYLTNDDRDESIGLSINDVPSDHDPLEVRGEALLTTLNKWFAYWLYDIENDVMDEAMVEIEHVDQSWEELKEWPRKDAEDKTLYLTNDDRDESIGLSINDVPSD